MTGTERTGGAPDVARIGALIGDRARARVLMALADGRALPSTVLAAEAGVAASTMSEHLARLLDAGLVTAQRQGRARYFRLADASVASALEAIARIAPVEPVRSLRQGTRAHALRRARTCYDHLAGRLGVALMAALIGGGMLEGGDGHHRERGGSDRLSAAGRDVPYQLTGRGRDVLAGIGVDVTGVLHGRSTLRYCVDWSEQRHHLAGPLGAAVARRLFELDWIRRAAQPRAVRITVAGEHGLRETFGLDPDWAG